MKTHTHIWCLLFCWSSILLSQEVTLTDWNEFEKEFAKEYRRLHLPNLSISYLDNLELIQNKRTIDRQEIVFLKYKYALQTIDQTKLSQVQALDYALVAYEIDMNLLRIALEKKWHTVKPKHISQEGLQHVPLGKEWYAYFLKRWIDVTVTPKELYQFGLSEIERAKKAMKAIQVASGMDSLTFQKYLQGNHFYYNDVDTIQHQFETYKKEIVPKLIGAFPKVNELQDVKIERGRNEAYGQVPAYYAEYDNTFYYNYFNTPFNTRQIAWIYLHEAIPGHHYQIKFENQLKRSTIKELFSYNGYRESWAAYVEEIGNDFNAYTTIYDEYGKWEWDIIRSVRVAMDVGLNYYDWSDEKALAFWKQHIKGQDAIAMREINRIKQWPAQVITYKYGANKILEWKRIIEAKLADGEPFPWLEFHTKILQYGALPFSIMDTLLF
ncbi:DUF885 domain-containing protein [Kordia zhangzhouensis]|uniref:DUF885 domain-containing protein n=1 Tax=Kordia zhangzhouensis TaxID=1620405 RepID=UPI000B164444|nr:DUF885 domain-containing protein [Kordia zhangzhouensis]